MQKALLKHNLPKELILHSDQGVQFTSKAFVDFCLEYHIVQSMRKADCPYDSAPMESFFGKLKNEHLNHYSIKNESHLRSLIEDNVYCYYDHMRPHSAFGGQTSMEARSE
ncbi:DDE-type integrase/transposase/recombinase [Hazenella sp. IB182353]|uniref:integrase core domain-containing protein n=1 Tax=Polycladospora coralii TaxID=2771432 RepID=UPI001747065C|nr:integrase core domain-containing protein [Polycladospora coralii]MBS7531163.1 DDE-type integrase/transposase/recombinase [Polycladospora coralii]